ncbi:biosynthetic-type acetolactate synthase large subunit, partial [Opitutaceae bacterium]|nr:biosynthetic-type acetolactate synthase large subunit [Opitutaceae bacterium]
MKHTGAEILIKLLERQGIQQIAGIPGGANLPMYDALSRSGNIRHILARHEQGAGFIAQGQARVTGRPAVFFATSGPGATNAISAVADAKLDSIPVICITGQVPQAMIGTDAFQEIDTYGLSVPITKHSFFARSSSELLEIVPAAFRIAQSGRPGPVWIDIPKDVQLEQVWVDEWPLPGRTELLPKAGPSSIQLAATMINEAKRPIVYVGGGAIHSTASDRVRTMVETLNAPTVMTLMGLGAIPVRHPLSLGMLGMHAARYTNQALEECDMLIALGARFDDRATGKVAQFCPNAKIVHIDIDASELNKIKNAHVGIVADLNEALISIQPLVKSRPSDGWNDRISQLKRSQPMQMEDLQNPLSPYGIIDYVARMLEGETYITTDVGQHQMRVAQAFPFERPRQWLTSGGLGTMGFGLPAAIGAALEKPEATVVCFSGDGSLLMNIQELITAVEENANVKIVLCNNNSLGLVHQQQDLFYGKRIFASNYSRAVDFRAIAEGFQMEAFDLGDCNDPV